ncbi:MAG: 1-deoxy-D-xylulose-5-phosphate reductoisomerase [Desulfobacteraceae bacterium]
MKTIALLGSTGSIGRNALDVIASNPQQYRVEALVAGQNISLLAEQVKRFQPRLVAVMNAEPARELRESLGPETPTEVLWGRDGCIRAATLEGVNTVISAITGAAGLEPTYAAVQSGKNVALANKETLVMAGDLVMRKAAENGVHILPIDSEHSAVLQSLQGHRREDLKRIILTASGGPFRDLSLEEMASVTPEQALNHPNWDMGPKVTVDSATLMNKGLEVIEARWLFGLDISRISVLIHPQSIIHSMAEYRDGSVIAQLGVPHMITPISYALSYPRHLETSIAPLDFHEIPALTFEKPDLERFRCLGLALHATETGASIPAVLNAANEIAVEAFLDGELSYLGIAKLVERVMEMHVTHAIETIENVMEADEWARRTARDVIGRQDMEAG